jgi:hypothetical protein
VFSPEEVDVDVVEVDVDVAAVALVFVAAAAAVVVFLVDVTRVVAAAAVVFLVDVARVVAAAAAVVFLVDVVRVVVAVPATHCEYPTCKVNHQTTRLPSGLNSQSLYLVQTLPETQAVSPVQLLPPYLYQLPAPSSTSGAGKLTHWPYSATSAEEYPASRTAAPRRVEKERMMSENE